VGSDASASGCVRYRASSATALVQPRWHAVAELAAFRPDLPLRGAYRPPRLPIVIDGASRLCYLSRYVAGW